MQPITTSEHVFVSGITGGGKSKLCEVYLSQFPRAIKLDTKGDALDALSKGQNPWPYVHPKQLAVVSRFKDVQKIADSRRYVIYAPEVDELDYDFFDVFFRWVYYSRRGTHTAIWVDEYMEVSPNPSQIPLHLKYLYTKGRSRFTPVWTCTQRPTGVNQIAFSQSTHFFTFDLPLPQDRKKLAEATGAPEHLDLPTGYNFWYFRRGWRAASKGVLKL